MRTAAERAIRRRYTAGLEDGGRDREPRSAGRLWRLEKAGKLSLPEPAEECPHLDFRNSDPQRCKRTTVLF